MHWLYWMFELLPLFVSRLVPTQRTKGNINRSWSNDTTGSPLTLVASFAPYLELLCRWEEEQKAVIIMRILESSLKLLMSFYASWPSIIILNLGPYSCRSQGRTAAVRSWTGQTRLVATYGPACKTIVSLFWTSIAVSNLYTPSKGIMLHPWVRINGFTQCNLIYCILM